MHQGIVTPSTTASSCNAQSIQQSSSPGNNHLDCSEVFDKIREEIRSPEFSFESLGIDLSSSITENTPELMVNTPILPISSSSTSRPKSWLLNYTVISFLMNGQLFSEYQRISNMLGLPHCSSKHWRETGLVSMSTN